MVSVIIPTYNRASAIQKSVDSVLGQTYPDIEVIVVDDGSSDNTEEIVRRIPDGRVKYIRHTANRGACAARNTGIKVSKGSYIAFQDCGDIWHREKLRKQLNIMEDTGADVTFCNMRKQGCEAGEKLPYRKGFINKEKNVIRIGTPVIAGKASVFKEMQFNEKLPRLQDFEILFRIREKYSIYYLDEVLVDYSCSDSGISTSPAKLLQACRLLLEMHPDITGKYHKMSDHLANLLLKDARLQNNKEIRKELCRLAFKYSFGAKVVVKFLLLSINVGWEKNAKGYVVLQRMK